MANRKAPAVDRTRSKPPVEPISRARLRVFAGIALIVGIVLLIYWPAIHGSFILDDDLLLTDNSLVKSHDGLIHIWFTRDAVDYWPVTNTSFWVQWRLWGMDPTGYHITNLVLHIADCLLIWLLLKRLLIPGGFLAAILFAVHPVNVESVAWIAQHKNLLALLFFLLSLLWYLKSQTTAVTQLENQPRRPPGTADLRSFPLNRWYFLSLLAFTLAMLSKGSVAILPLLLLLIIWWQRSRISQSDLWRTAPFFAIAIALTIVNIWFRTHGADTAIRSVTFAQRFAGAGAALWFYLFKALLPLNLVFVYPQWNIDLANPLWWLPLAAVVALTVVLIRAAYSSKNAWPRNLLFAWAFFCIALLPVLGFVDVGYMKHSLVADHYQHIALIGIVALFAAAGTAWYRHSPTTVKIILRICAASAVALLALLSWRQTQLYANSITLYETTLEQNPSSWLIQTNLSVDLADVDRTQEAIEHAQEALRLKPNYAEAHTALGVALAKQGKTDQAIEEYRTALELNADFAEAASNLGAALGGKGQMPQAIEYLQRAVQLKPYYFEAHRNLARALAAVGRLPEAHSQLQTAAQLRPDDVDCVINLGSTAHALGRDEEALSYYRQAVQMRPNLPEGYIRLTLIYSELNRSADAIAAAEHGLQLAQSSGQTEIAQQFESLLQNYRRQQANPSGQNH